MKIVCDSCGAKYQIADEKVQGKQFKIRCKKCGAAIVVRGDQGGAGAAAEAAPAAAVDYGGDAVWHVVVDGDQQGPFSPAQISAMLSENRIGWDAYIWREGFDEWKPAQDVQELVDAVMNPGGAAPAEAAPAGGDPFGEPAAAAPVAEAAPAARPKRDAGTDLFAKGDEDDVVASAAQSPRVSASQAMTGQRNENSVLFSLSNLQALATSGPAGGPAPAPTAPKAGMATGEGSGLIDIRALAGSLNAAPAGPSAPAKVDDLLSIGAPPVGLGSALAAPVIIPDKPKEGGNRAVVFVGAFVGIAVIAAAAIVAVAMRPADPAGTAGATAALAPGAAPPAAPAVAAAAPGAVAAPAAAPAPGVVAAPGAAPAPGAAAAAGAPPAAAPAPAPEAAPTAERERPSGSGGSRRGSSGGSSTRAEAAPAAAPAAPASSGSSGSSGRSSGGGGGGGDRSIDDLLNGALSGSGGSSARRGSSGGSSAAAAPSGGGGGGGSLPATPSRDDVRSAMNGVQPAVTACGNGEHGSATVAVSVSGSNGRVTNANVTGAFAGTPVGTCIARAVRGATFPRFQQATFSVTYPFRI